MYQQFPFVQDLAFFDMSRLDVIIRSLSITVMLTFFDLFSRLDIKVCSLLLMLVVTSCNLRQVPSDVISGTAG